MRAILAFVILLIFLNKYGISTELKSDTNINSYQIENHVLPTERNPSTEILPKNNSNVIRSFRIKNIWKKIKNTALKAWNLIKIIANNINIKITRWNQEIKKRTDEILKAFEFRLKNLKTSINEIIINILGTADLVKKCAQKENDILEKVLTQIMKYVNSCITGNVVKLSLLQNNQLHLELNDTQFEKHIENKLNRCLNKSEKVAEKCFEKTEKEILNDIENTENDLYKNQLISRGITDDLLSAMISCSADGLLEATSLITRGTLRIVKCVMKG